ncbi:sulfatase family protein [Parvularcula maris]|uniref:Sulfatase-like hydrolase/transferase n=1 Tax=Parvularcula maris TaxID=2965077 RepID=A0A9X2RIB7_9PROT|nr:sulfatase-like hydrolase/transferase [Parvularcula maris]
MTARRPNILLFMTDQHRADHVGFGGNQIVRTPNLDALADRGRVFDRAYVANPICMPNRASIMTGMMPSGHGTRMNGIDLDWGINTFARVARKAGYKTGLVGKSHLQVMNDAAEAVRAILGSEPPEDGRRLGWPDGWADHERMDLWRQGDVEVPEDFYGFDHVRLTVFHSDLCSGHYYRWLLEKGVDPKNIQGRAVALDGDFGTQQVWRTSMPEELYPTTYVAEEAVSFLRDQEGSDDPFLLKVSFPDPHHPFTPPGRYFDMYDAADIPLPKTFYDPHDSSVPSLRKMTRNRGDGVHLMMPFSPTEDQFKRMAAAEYGMITMIDDAVGRVLTALEESGQADDTLIVFTADHGDMFGDHGLMLKVSLHYDACIRVPLVIAGPGVSSGRTDSFASSIDLCPTLIGAMGLEPYYGIAGHDLAPVLQEREASVRDHVLVEEQQIFPDPATGAPIDMLTLVTDEGRLTLRRGEELIGDLYDHGEDRDEMHNIYGDPASASLRTSMFERLVAAQMETSRALRKPVAQG